MSTKLVTDLSTGEQVRVKLTAADEAALEASRGPTYPTRAELTALSRASFFSRLDAALALDPEGPLVEEHVEAVIKASPLTPSAKRTALNLLRNAVRFERADPDYPGLMDGIGAILGLSSDQIDQMFEQT